MDGEAAVDAGAHDKRSSNEVDPFVHTGQPETGCVPGRTRPEVSDEQIKAMILESDAHSGGCLLPMLECIGQ